MILKNVSFSAATKIPYRENRVMADVNKRPRDVPDDESSGDCKNVEKILSLVVKRRKTIPTKCMEINKRLSSVEILRLENAKVVTDDDEASEKFRKMIQGFRTSRELTDLKKSKDLEDLNEAELRLGKYLKRTREINSYLEKRKHHAQSFPFV